MKFKIGQFLAKFNQVSFVTLPSNGCDCILLIINIGEGNGLVPPGN